jgi:hypothetical protein
MSKWVMAFVLDVYLTCYVRRVAQLWLGLGILVSFLFTSADMHVALMKAGAGMWGDEWLFENTRRIM